MAESFPPVDCTAFQTRRSRTGSSSFDLSFGRGGKVTTVGGGMLAIPKDGRLVTSVDAGLVRYNTNGSLERSFGSGGKAATASAPVSLEPARSSLEEGVARFRGAETREASLVAVLELVEDHHAGYGDDPPVSVIEVIGLELSAAAIDELDAYDYSHIEQSKNGFVARRPPV